MSLHTSGVIVRLTERGKHMHLTIVQYWCLIIIFKLYRVNRISFCLNTEFVNEL